MLRPCSTISPYEIRPVSGIPRRDAETANPLMKPMLEPGFLDEPRRHRIVATGHDQDAWTAQQLAQAIGRRHRVSPAAAFTSPSKSARNSPVR